MQMCQIIVKKKNIQISTLEIPNLKHNWLSDYKFEFVKQTDRKKNCERNKLNSKSVQNEPLI